MKPKKSEKLRIPSAPTEAQKKIKEIQADLKAHEGIWEDGACPKLKIRVGKFRITWTIRVKVASKWTPYTIGHGHVMDILTARGHAWAIVSGSSYATVEDIDAVVGRRKKSEEECPTVIDAFDLAFNDRVERGVIKEKSIKTYRPALKATGPEFYNRSLNLLTQDEIENMAHYIRQTYSRSYFDNFRVSLEYTYAYARRKEWGIKVNLAAELKKIPYDVIDDDPAERIDLNWPEMKALWGWLSDSRCPLTMTQIRLYKTVMIVGERIASLCCAEWADIDLDSGWWIIPPEKRKTQMRYEKHAHGLAIKLTEPLLDILGDPHGESKYMFPSETDFGLPYPHGSLPIWNLFRVRDAEWIKQGRADLVEGNPDAAWCPINKRERNYQRRYSKFLIPSEVPRVNHHELGRHTVATRAIECGIPGLYVSLMVGHSKDKALPGNQNMAHSAFQNVDQGGRTTTLPAMSRKLRRKADAASGASKTTKRFYLHNEHEEGLEVAWFLWAEAFCQNVLGEVPKSVRDAVDASKGTDDKILDALLRKFGGNLEAALQHIQAGHMEPTLHVVKNKGISGV